MTPSLPLAIFFSIAIAGCDDGAAKTEARHAAIASALLPAQTLGARPPPRAPSAAASPAVVEMGPSRLETPPVDASGPCPSDMARIYAYCIDRYEAPNVAGAYPLVMESAFSAEAWCAKRDKRLCTEDEWERACAGPQGSTYPYGDAHEDAACSDEKEWITKDESTIVMWPEKPAMGEVTRLYQASKSASYPRCVSGYGVHDMTGNVEEWVVAGKRGKYNYEHVLKGCYWSGCYGGSKPTCKSTNAAHADAFKFYETGFRCCKDAKGR